jgi:hypothetical protein
MVTLVQLARLPDSVVFAVSIVLLAAASLYFLGNFYAFALNRKQHGIAFLSKAVENILPMKGKKWDYDLTDVLLFALLVCILSMGHHSYLDLKAKAIEKEEEKKKKKKA